jgi:hypothetical protein
MKMVFVLSMLMETLYALTMTVTVNGQKTLVLPENIYGYASSLIMYNNILAVQFDSNEKISLMGFDIGSGELIYETIRKGRPSGPLLS